MLFNYLFFLNFKLESNILFLLVEKLFKIILFFNKRYLNTAGKLFKKKVTIYIILT